MVIKPGSTSVSFRIQITTDAGLPVTGLVAATFPALSYIRDKEAMVAITPLTDLALITSTFTANGVKEYGNGYYRVDVPDAAWATASNVILSGETTDKRVIAEPVEVREVPLTDSNGRVDVGEFLGNPVSPAVNGRVLSALTSIGSDLIAQQVAVEGTSTASLIDVDLAGLLGSDPNSFAYGTFSDIAGSTLIVGTMPARNVESIALVSGTIYRLTLDFALPAVPTTDISAYLVKLPFAGQSAAGRIKRVTTTDVATGLGADAITAAATAASFTNEVADAVLARSVTNVEAGSAQYSLASVILAMFKMSVSGTTLTIYRTDGTTVQFTETLTLNAAAVPITGVT